MDRRKMRSEMIDIFPKMEKRIIEYQDMLRMQKEEYANYNIIFLYGAGTDSSVIVKELGDDLCGKEVYFIDKNKNKHGQEITSGIFCYGMDKMYGKGNAAMILITSSAYADDISFELRMDNQQTEDRLKGIDIFDEFAVILVRVEELKSCLKRREKIIALYDSFVDDFSCNLLYRSLRKMLQGNSFRDFDPDDYILPCEEFVPSIIAERVDKRSSLVCSGVFLGEMLQEMEKMTDYSYARSYVFEINRLYLNHQKDKFAGIKNITINAGLGEINQRIDRSKIHGNAYKEYSYLNWCSDDFVDVYSLDEYVKEHGITDKFSFIKIAMENTEMATLRGMKETIKRDKPIIAISLYPHFLQPQEFPEHLASYLNDLVPEYKFMIRSHRYASACGTVLYALTD